MANSEMTGRRSRRADDESDEDASEAQAQVIGSLRAQVTDLFSQVTQLNSKLVASYDRVSDLEDQLHNSSSSLRNASVTISALELERSHHLAALNTGLLVEKVHVTTELNRLMERATEEAAQRGQAESARRDIEKDLDDLSASLFDQANTMVAEARLGQAKSERKVQEAEQALRIAEDAVKGMQVQMQSLQAAKETAERGAQEAGHTVCKGKWVERDELHVGDVPRIRFMTTHTPYAEFVTFISYLRGLRVSQSNPPVISTLLNQPFIARLLTEDSEPTVRLDLAPSLNWLSRRSVFSAIHAGMLTVEPWPFSSLVQELQPHPQSQSSSTLSCALCGTFIARLSTTTPVSRSHSTNGSSWFKYPLALGSPQNHSARTPSAEREPPAQVYIFRVASVIASAPPPVLAPTHASSASVSAVGTSSRPSPNATSSSRVPASQTQNSPYPLCTSNYCLTRLRSTCSLWAFVRVGIVERIWEEEVVQPLKPHVNGDTNEKPPPRTSADTGSQPAGTVDPSASEKPPVPPRRRRLWDMAVSWGKESGENAKEKVKEIEKENDDVKKLYPPPPSHPSVPHPRADSPTSQANAVIPPPLPRRNVVRARATTDTFIPSSAVQNGTSASAAKESVAYENVHVNTDTIEPNASNSSSSPVEEVTFTAPPSPPSPMTSHPIPTEPSSPPIEDHSPSSPRNVPLPITPTTSNSISRVTSPVPRSRSRLSSPASLPPGTRPASPAIGRSRAGSPTPTGIARVTPPAPGHPPSASYPRGKVPMSSPLASERSSSPAPAVAPGAPPLPRRAAARRAVPPPPVSGSARTVQETDKEEGVVPPSLTSDEPNPEAHGLRSDEVSGERKTTSDGHGGIETVAVAVIEEVAVSQMASEPAPTEVAPEPAHDVTAEDEARDLSVNENENAGLDPIPPPTSAPEDGKRTSMDTTGTKLSSSTEGEGFASDATWEDRTWKTLLLLKEDMFWARIGGLRALEES